MLVMLGSVCTAAAILAVALLTLTLNHPNAPRWVQGEATAFLGGVIVTIVLGLGLGCLAVTAVDMLAGGTTFADIAAPLGALALVVLALRALKVGARMEGYRVAAAPLPPPAA